MIPVLNIARKDFSLRTEVTFLFKEYELLQVDSFECSFAMLICNAHLQKSLHRIDVIDNELICDLV